MKHTQGIAGAPDHPVSQSSRHLINLFLPETIAGKPCIDHRFGQNGSAALRGGLVSSARFRQCKRESRAFVGFAFDPDAAAVVFHKFFAQD